MLHNFGLLKCIYIYLGHLVRRNSPKLYNCNDFLRLSAYTSKLNQYTVHIYTYTYRLGGVSVIWFPQMSMCDSSIIIGTLDVTVSSISIWYYYWQVNGTIFVTHETDGNVLLQSFHWIVQNCTQLIVNCTIIATLELFSKFRSVNYRVTVANFN